ncbi:hypothetical protein PN462_21430 [Spirulina sp. CS-785/01]|uniref:hypothetical protein n=1 Tax=Spirulina sp. CS-785/01 TaxID=3021716 RepID=UPI0023311276|nr:hypothetical protein [Spirulina sp. CS-785/01]MDB9315690.1 hypothetical protein [Spirulina sp. CS-785/01]
MATTLDKKNVRPQTGQTATTPKRSVSPYPRLEAYWVRDEQGKLYCQWRRADS